MFVVVFLFLGVLFYAEYYSISFISCRYVLGIVTRGFIVLEFDFEMLNIFPYSFAHKCIPCKALESGCWTRHSRLTLSLP